MATTLSPHLSTTAQANRLPNFFIVGAAKAGTTALHHYLQQHPAIYMTPGKETNFFAYEGQQLNFRGPGDEAVADFSITNLADYQAQFQGVTTETAIGEACPLYLYDCQVAQRIQHHCPTAKIIIILREPVARAYANYLHLVRDGRETTLDFAQALAQEPKRTEANWEWFWHYQQAGYYTEQIQIYYNLFPANQIRVYLYEDLRRDAQGLMQDIFTFLGINAQFLPDFSERPNKSGMPKNSWLHGLLTKPNVLKALVKPLLPQKLRQSIQHSNLTTPPLDPVLKQQLQTQYREDILACQALIKRDLTSWLP
ncbi:sulfotransferase [Synechocystis sp. PCC 7339]|uniref:sulfotransferase family protein n=1 Tax=Synechocystis sp. PCC 7339 TaxID=2782213 RepID=UPI001CBBB65D|nr:sulfotransferase [Synechocystis sp. PCC 7339]UAJ73834.1 sulfotransferase [Synechocystis sp. PCC 7339]